MSIKIISDRLRELQLSTAQEEEYALRQIAQEITLLALSRSDFFTRAAFQGGTCLRIIHGIDRFSEDLDFVLTQPNPEFAWEGYFGVLDLEFRAYGLSIEMKDRSKADQAVKRAFLKEDSLGYQLDLQFIRQWHYEKKIQIKLEIDTNPPAGSQCQLAYLDFPIDFPVLCEDLASLFSGKLLALVSRPYVKGRDWYDFLWYVGKKTQVNWRLLQNGFQQAGLAIQDLGPKSLENILVSRIASIDWPRAIQDVERFVGNRTRSTLELWHREFFVSKAAKLAGYLQTNSP